MRRPIVNNSAPGDSVYEPFSGSGTTIIAGEMTGRKVYACEIAPEYVDIAVVVGRLSPGRERRSMEMGAHSTISHPRE
jgi:predicted O-methyltransferase YrrM